MRRGHLARIFHTGVAGAPTFSRLLASEVRKGSKSGTLDRWLCPKPTASRRSTLSAFHAAYELSGLGVRIRFDFVLPTAAEAFVEGHDRD